MVAAVIRITHRSDFNHKMAHNPFSRQSFGMELTMVQ
jgi:hypothetical protein